MMIAKLREMLSLPPSEEVWTWLQMNLSNPKNPDEHQLLLDYALRHTDDWPPSLCHLIFGVHISNDYKPVWLPLTRELRFKHANLKYHHEMIVEQLPSHWPSLVSLDLSNQMLAEDLLSCLEKLPWTPQLQHINLQNNRLSATGGMALLETPWLSQWKSLNLAGNSIGPKVTEALVTSPKLTQVTSLDLSKNNVGQGGRFLTLLQEKRWTPKGIRHLSLAGNRLQPDFFEWLSTQEDWNQLESLDLSENNPGSAGLRALAEWTPPPTLRHLRLRKMRRSRDPEEMAEAWSVLLASPLLRQLSTLVIDSNEWEESALESLLRSPWSVNITSLTILPPRSDRQVWPYSGSLLKELAIHPLGKAVTSTALQVLVHPLRTEEGEELELDFDNLDLTDDALFSFAGSPALLHCRVWRLGQNLFRGETLAELIHQQPMPALKTLELNSCGWTDLDVINFCTCLPSLPALEELDLSFNQLEVGGALTLAASGLLQQLKSLKLQGNRIGQSGLESILSPETTSTLESLDISYLREEDLCFQELGRTPHYPKLKELILQHGQDTEQTLMGIVEQETLPALEKVKSQSFIPGRQFLRWWSKLPERPFVLECPGESYLDYVRGNSNGYLSFYSNNTSPAVLAEYPHLDTIHSLYLSYISLSDEDFSALLRGVRKKGLLQRVLSRSSSELTALESLSLHQIETLTPEGLQQLWTDASLPKLRTLSLHGMHRENNALYSSFFESELVEQLTSLTLQQTSLQEDTLRKLFQRSRPLQLTYLSLNLNQCSTEFLEEILFSNEMPELNSVFFQGSPLANEQVESWAERLPFSLNVYTWG